MSDNHNPAGSRSSRRALIVTAVIAVAVAGVAGYSHGRARAGRSPLDGRPASGAVLARFDGETVTAAEIEALAGPADGPLRAQFRDPAARKEFVEGWTRTLLLARRAEAEGFHRAPEFARS